MIHYKLGECDAPTSSTQGKNLCAYCSATVKEDHTPSLKKRRVIEPILRENALLPNIDRLHRVPDLLHCIKNVTKFLLKKICGNFISKWSGDY